MGGAFGGKQDPWPLMAGALATYRVGRPVRLTYTRRESFDASPKRHPFAMALRVGARRDGSLTGLGLQIVANTGAYDCDGYHIPEFALVAGGGPYRWQAVDAAATVVYTNAAKAGQMRGFGTPQPTFARECMLDEMASRLGIDPLELRLRNAIDGSSVTFLGYPVAETVGYRECLEAARLYYDAALERAKDLSPSRAGDSWRHGVGLAGMWYRFGKGGRIQCEADAEVGLEGRITLYFAAPDYGQGTATVMAQLAAEALGVPRDDLRLVNADTAVTPDSGIQGASRSTYWVGGAVVRAAEVLKQRLLGKAAEMLACAPQTLMLGARAVVAPGGQRLPLADVADALERSGMSRRVRGVFWPGDGGDAGMPERPGYLPYFVTGIHVAEVRVNVETGEVDVERVVAIHDVGRIINPQSAKGQVEGAVLMGVGAALMEEYVPGVSTGFSDYYLPTIKSAPAIHTVFVEAPSRWGPQGAKGLGEAAALPTAPAILNGICHAAGARVRQLPATPERVLAAVRATRGAAS
jgi:aldehyde oxidoreductase